MVDLMNLGWLEEPGLTYLSLNQLSFFGTACVGGSASPFIDEGDGFTSERERVRMLLSLVTHADRYEIMVGAHNTVNVTAECQMHVGGGVVLFGCADVGTCIYY